MPDPTPVDPLTFATQMVVKYQNLLASAAGLKSIEIDGQTVRVSDLTAEYVVWSSKLARLNGSRPRVFTIDMSNAQ